MALATNRPAWLASSWSITAIRQVTKPMLIGYMKPGDHVLCPATEPQDCKLSLLPGEYVFDVVSSRGSTGKVYSTGMPGKSDRVLVISERRLVFSAPTLEVPSGVWTVKSVLRSEVEPEPKKKGNYGWVAIAALGLLLFTR